jgi:DNA-binding NarL/FixJ family response regulator
MNDPPPLRILVIDDDVVRQGVRMFLDLELGLEIVALMGSAEDRTPVNASLPHLTERELDVLRELAQGRANKEIARALDLSDETIKTYVKRILRKLGVQSRTQAAVQAVTRGLLPRSP